MIPDFDLKTFLFSGIVLLIVDYVYLSSTKKYFNKVVKSIQGKDIKIKYSGVVLCYLSLVIALNYFILNQNKLTDNQKIKNAFILGLVIYAVFEGTTYAIFDNWTLEAVIMDSVWGGVLFALTTFIILKIKKLKY